MRKIALLSLFIYVFYILIGIVMIIQGNKIIEELSSTPGGFEGVATPINNVIGFFLAILGLIGLVFKLLHLGTRWRIFALPTLALDILMVCAVVVIFTSGNSETFTFAEKVAWTLITLPPAASALSNLASLAG